MRSCPLFSAQTVDILNGMDCWVEDLVNIEARKE